MMSAAALITQVASIDVANVTPICAKARRVYSDPDELRKKVDCFLLAYDKQEAEMRRKSNEVEVDEDGFTLVKPSFSTSMSVVDSRLSSKKRKNRAEDLKDFYVFQLKERKMAEWKDEKKRESGDKIKFNEMKSSNKFQL